ncbi:DUF58 domain-containing protein [Leptospira perolatii]|uniref:DUF58 domain-containing protein n=1 Tax=Leptospira perolatii TaxID=2023191 RepID=A0A2M9ZPK3_9LEPT|nr:DUF58 domain-containing protein [Leptospira perolatii]PJZ70726.1 DUF58 domain-containing protein [Leptospira perolatii]PJZ73935.1 DUF58 domain-containing protein [Leptospira perolatii]
MLRKEYQNLIRLLEFKEKGFSVREKQGWATSTKKGRGLDFKDVRPYTVGDDTRLIDWNVTSRLGELHVREFYEEKERLGIFFLDVSESMDWGSGKWKKSENAFQVLALLVLLYVRNGNPAKILLYSDELEYETGFLRTVPEALPALEKVRMFSHSGKKTNPELPFSILKNRVRRYTDTYILSDFIGTRSLKKLSILRKVHNLHAIRFIDPLEEGAPKWLFSFFLTSDPEIGKTHLEPSAQVNARRNLENLFKDRILDLEGSEDDPSKIFAYWRKTR